MANQTTIDAVTAFEAALDVYVSQQQALATAEANASQAAADIQTAQSNAGSILTDLQNKKAAAIAAINSDFGG